MSLPDLPDVIPLSKLREALAVIGVPDLKGLYAIKSTSRDVTFKRRVVNADGTEVKTETTIRIDRTGRFDSNEWGD
jgi:hypothetical protein